MNDTTWFWQIVDARGLADVSSEETVALREILDRSHRAEAEIEMLREALKPFAKAAEDCGVEDDLRIGVVKPADIIWESAVAVSITYAHVDRARKVLENGPAGLADATSNPPDPSLSSLRKGADVAGWHPINSAPEDEWLLVATTGGWVGEAMVVNGDWSWASGRRFHSNIVPLKWMPLPAHPDAVGEAPACLTPAEQKQQAARCACRGADDYCPCQNTPDATTIRIRSALVSGSREDGA